MKICSVCGEIGIHRPKDPHVGIGFVVAVADGAYAHPKCCGLERLLALGDGELDSIRLCDVSHRTMRAIVDRKEKKGRVK